MCIALLVENIDQAESLQGLPPEIVILVLSKILSKGKLNPQNFKLFRECECPEVSAYINQLGIKDVPVFVATERNRWPTEKPSWL